MARFQTITKEKFAEFVYRLLKNHQVIGPVRKDGSMQYHYISDPNQLYMDYKGHTLLPPKRFFFSEEEVLFTYKIKDGGKDVEIHDSLEFIRGLRVFIGIRPCDIEGLKALDEVFLSEFHDPYYKSRRENTLIIGLTCNEAAEYCFCSYTKTGPLISDGFDLLLTDIGDFYLVEVGSEMGSKLLDLNLDLFMDAREEDIEKREEAIRNVRRQIERYSLIDLTDLYKPMVDSFEDSIWEEYGSKCLSCGKCNFACPTCRCFDVYDDPNLQGDEGRRVRVWDSCHFLSFTRVSTGEVFRKERHSRLKQRLYHKYCYSIDEIGRISCVGCGRCIDVCSAGIDIREVIKRVYEKWKGRIHTSQD